MGKIKRLNAADEIFTLIVKLLRASYFASYFFQEKSLYLYLIPHLKPPVKQYFNVQFCGLRA